jgi:D-sedoheptulose 7-phosphate isomerase
MQLSHYLASFTEAIAATMRSPCIAKVDEAASTIIAVLSQAKPLLVCGNGGSASDAMHITAELVGRFKKERKAMNCICLTCDAAVLTAWANDYSFETVFARQVEAYGRLGGALMGISTSGNSANVIRAFETAKSLGLTTIALTGEAGGALGAVTDILIDVPSRETAIIQQLHMCIYHYLCDKVETALC